jgi:phosphatidylserine/phosphatidylglycerophosphate/cardiolipin synthase-like enzyme
MKLELRLGVREPARRRYLTERLLQLDHEISAHAKLVVADDTLAYVGSANLLSSSEELSLETGLLIEGAAAAQVARLVDGVLRVARSL